MGHLYKEFHSGLFQSFAENLALMRIRLTKVLNKAKLNTIPLAEFLFLERIDEKYSNLRFLCPVRKVESFLPERRRSFWCFVGGHQQRTKDHWEKANCGETNSIISLEEKNPSNEN